MNPIVDMIFVGVLFVLFSTTKIYSHPVDFGSHHKWGTRHHPFPEMSRFLNSHSHIHRKSTQPSYSFLGYICSVAEDEKSIQDILNTFEGNYGSIIMNIIEQDCPKYNQHHKRSIMNINKKNFSQTLFIPHIIDYQYKL